MPSTPNPRRRSPLSKVHSRLKRLAAAVTDREKPDTDIDRFDIPSPLACLYLDTRAGTKLSDSTVRNYEACLQEYTAFLHDQPKDVLNAEKSDLIEYVEWCVERGNRKSTIQSKLSVTKELYKFIVIRTDYGPQLSLTPVEIETIDLDDYNTPPTMEREALSREELRRLFDAMDSYRNRLMAVVLAETGVRNSELRNIRVTDVDFDGPSIHIRNPKNARPYDVPLSQDLRAELEIWCSQYHEAYGGAQTSQFLFPSHHGEKLTTNDSLNRIIREAAEEAGIQDTIGRSELSDAEKQHLETNQEYAEWHRVTTHTLRHTCLTLMKDDGVPLQYRQLVANHSDPATTQHYSHGTEQEFDTIRNRYDPPR